MEEKISNSSKFSARDLVLNLPIKTQKIISECDFSDARDHLKKVRKKGLERAQFLSKLESGLNHS